MTNNGDAETIIGNFLGRVATASSPADFLGADIDPAFTLDIVGRTAISGHYASFASICHVLFPLLRQRLASASYKIVQTIKTSNAVAAQLELTAVVKTGAVYNPRHALSTLVLTLQQGRIIHARLWLDTEQVERKIFGNNFA